jgi:catechol 2,3-dioxygenase-like lactoylglutathione lyase family enzyme
MTGRSHDSMLVPGVQHVDHVAFTVPDLDTAVHFFVQAFGAEELYRSERGPDCSWRCCACRRT